MQLRLGIFLGKSCHAVVFDMPGKYRLIGTKCINCDLIYFPPRGSCTACGKGGLIEHKIAETGRVLTYTIIHVAPEGFESPYCIAIVEMDDGAIIAGQVVSFEGIEIDKKVEAAFRKIYETEDGLINYGFKFELIE